MQDYFVCKYMARSKSIINYLDIISQINLNVHFKKNATVPIKCFNTPKIKVQTVILKAVNNFNCTSSLLIKMHL